MAATTVHGKSIAGSFQSRKLAGFSLRQSLLDQGVTTEEGVRKHLSFIDKTLAVNPNMDITRYRVSKVAPNELPAQMG